MENKLVTKCPRCNENLVVRRLSCDNCELELNGDFPLSKFDYLSTDELDFIESFLRAQGNYKTVQNEKNMSYPAVKKKFMDILDKLDITTKESRNQEDIKIEPLLQTINAVDSPVVKKIKEKLNANSGIAIIPLFRGDSCKIGYTSDGKGLVASKIPVANQLTWEVFDAAVEVVINNGGKAEKGKARSGAKLGSGDLPLNSVEGFIAHKVHGAQIGETAFGPGFVVAAILDWAGICNNERGYLTIRNM